MRAQLAELGKICESEGAGKTYIAPRKEVEKIKKRLAELKARQQCQDGRNGGTKQRPTA